MNILRAAAISCLVFGGVAHGQVDRERVIGEANAQPETVRPTDVRRVDGPMTYTPPNPPVIPEDPSEREIEVSESQTMEVELR